MDDKDVSVSDLVNGDTGTVGNAVRCRRTLVVSSTFEGVLGRGRIRLGKGRATFVLGILAIIAIAGSVGRVRMRRRTVLGVSPVGVARPGASMVGLARIVGRTMVLGPSRSGVFSGSACSVAVGPIRPLVCC